jgi:hypothetical protein
MPIDACRRLFRWFQPARGRAAGPSRAVPCKTHADRAGRPDRALRVPVAPRFEGWWVLTGPAQPDGCVPARARCDNPVRHCVTLAQGYPAVRSRWKRIGRAWRASLAAGLLTLAAGPAAAQACPAGAPVLQPLAPGVWRVPADDGDANAANRGQVSNLLVVADGPRLWLLGSGPSPAAGARLACVLRRDLGRDATDVVSPWPRPELVLGVAGLPGAPRHWAQADVADAMAARCAGCADRLRARLGAAAAELGPDPIRLPAERLAGDQGRLGPFGWWRLDRDPGHPVTVWRLVLADGTPLWWSPGLLNGSGPADGRDAHLPGLQAALAALVALVAGDGPRARHLGEQGGVQDAGLPARQQAYWLALAATVRAAQDAGRLESDPAPAWDGLPAGWAAHPWHALNWQRAWREVEQDDTPPAPKR